MNDFFEFFLPLMLFIGGLILLVFLLAFPLIYITATNQRNIINKKYHLNYSTMDYALNGDSIIASIRTDNQKITLQQKVKPTNSTFKVTSINGKLYKLDQLK